MVKWRGGERDWKIIERMGKVEGMRGRGKNGWVKQSEGGAKCYMKKRNEKMKEAEKRG